MGVFDQVLSDGGSNRQLPSNIVIPEFGEVNIRTIGENAEVRFTILTKQDKSGNWQTGVALDASDSMRSSYGRSLHTKSIPDAAMKEYQQKGWLKSVTRDGRVRTVLSSEGIADAKKNGHMKYTQNVMEPVGRKFIAHLAANLDEDGGTTALYWACGPGGDEYEVIGDLTEQDCHQVPLVGPKEVRFGGGTRLTPAVKYFVDRFADAERGIYVFLTDGRIDDMEELVAYTVQLAHDVAEGKRNWVKLVLVGLGDQVDVGQMAQLDDLETGTDVDIWDHKIAEQMREITDIFAEVVSDNMIVAPAAKVYDDSGQLVKDFTRGLTAAASFTMPAGSKSFELEVGGQRLKQTVVEP